MLSYILYIKYSELEVVEMEQRFNISGTYEDLKEILKKEFNLSDEAARIGMGQNFLWLNL